MAESIPNTRDNPSDYEPKDAWAHRTANMKCRTCMWFVEKGTERLGRCRRHAPTMAGYPVVYVSDWCGDHKLDETKVS